MLATAGSSGHRSDSHRTRRAVLATAGFFGHRRADGHWIRLPLLDFDTDHMVTDLDLDLGGGARQPVATLLSGKSIAKLLLRICKRFVCNKIERVLHVCIKIEKEFWLQRRSAGAAH